MNFLLTGFCESGVEQNVFEWTEEEALAERQRMFAEAHAIIICGAPAPSPSPSPSPRQPQVDQNFES